MKIIFQKDKRKTFFYLNKKKIKFKMLFVLMSKYEFCNQKNVFKQMQARHKSCINAIV